MLKYASKYTVGQCTKIGTIGLYNVAYFFNCNGESDTLRLVFTRDGYWETVIFWTGT